MRCMVCGREAMNPEANYCDYCGSSFHQYGENGWRAPAAQNGSPEGNSSEAGSRYTAFGTAEYREEVNTEGKGKALSGQRVSTWLFLGVMLLPFVPMVGSIAYLVILFYWAFASQINDARKNWARATLIYTGLVLILCFALIGSIMSSLAGVL